MDNFVICWFPFTLDLKWLFGNCPVFRVKFLGSLPDGGRETRARASYVLAGIVGCCAYAVVAMSRAYFRNIDALWKELENFTTDKATCHCCTLGHAEAGQTCDRKILLQCISVWFGSVETFEQTVRTRVLDILANHLRHELFSYKSCLACTAPILWHFLDTLAGDLYYRESERHFDDAFFQTLRALGWWLGCIPAMFFTMLLLSRAFRNHCGMFIFEILTNVVVLLGVVASFVVMQGLEYLGWMCMEVVAGQGKQGWIAFLFFTPFVTMLAWRLVCGIFLLAICSKWSPNMDDWRQKTCHKSVIPNWLVV